MQYYSLESGETPFFTSRCSDFQFLFHLTSADPSFRWVCTYKSCRLICHSSCSFKQFLMQVGQISCPQIDLSLRMWATAIIGLAKSSNGGGDDDGWVYTTFRGNEDKGRDKNEQEWKKRREREKRRGRNQEKRIQEWRQFVFLIEGLVALASFF